MWDIHVTVYEVRLLLFFLSSRRALSCRANCRVDQIHQVELIRNHHVIAVSQWRQLPYGIAVDIQPGNADAAVRLKQ